MRSALEVLLDRVTDPILRADIRSQVERLQSKRRFGLVFESHIPERVRLPQHPVRVGVKVCYRDDSGSPVFEVVALNGKTATLRKVRNSDGSFLSDAQKGGVADEKAPVGAVAVIADFGEAIFPGLHYLGSIKGGGNKPAHVVIK